MRRPLTDPVGTLALRTLVLLPVYLVVWYVASPVLHWPITWLFDGTLREALPQIVAGVEHRGLVLDIVTLLPVPAEWTTARPAGAAQLVLSIDPMLYTYGLPLFTALTIATPGARGGELATLGARAAVAARRSDDRDAARHPQGTVVRPRAGRGRRHGARPLASASWSRSAINSGH